MSKDLLFLKEMQGYAKSLLHEKFDITNVEMLNTMIEDWINELEKTNILLDSKSPRHLVDKLFWIRISKKLYGNEEIKSPINITMVVDENQYRALRKFDSFTEQSNENLICEMRITNS